MTVVGYAPGAFDMFHVGHLTLIRNAAARCDRLIVGVVSDALVTTTKHRTPMINERERRIVVGALRDVDDVVIEDVSKVAMWHRLRFDVLFKGDDWQDTPKGHALELAFGALGVRVDYLPYTAHVSSSSLRAALVARDVDDLSYGRP